MNFDGCLVVQGACSGGHARHHRQQWQQQNCCAPHAAVGGSLEGLGGAERGGWSEPQPCAAQGRGAAARGGPAGGAAASPGQALALPPSGSRAPARQQGLMRGKAAAFADSGALPSRGLKASAGVAGPGRAAARRRRAKLTILGNSTELARNQTKAPHTPPVQSAKLTCRLFRSAQRQRIAGYNGGMQNGRPRARKPHLQGPCTLGAKSAASCISHNSCKLLLKSTVCGLSSGGGRIVRVL